MSNPWDDDSDDFEEEIAEVSSNSYLTVPEKGLTLIGKLVKRSKSGIRASEHFNDIVDEKIMPHLYLLEGVQREVLDTLARAKTQITELHKASVLSRRAVLGVGGKFSSGKSRFINSLTGASLPEGQKPTTSIATYIVKADQSENFAVTSNGSLVPLDEEALEALSHEFSRTYKNIGFVRILDTLIVQSSSFRYPDIAILDTPGYSKADLGKNADAGDAEIALHQLRSVDALIWLMDIENGVINDSDLKFIESLKIDAKILFVFNKADLRPLETVRQVVEKTKKILSGKPEFKDKTYGVIAYSSYNNETLVGGDLLQKFLDETGVLANTKKNVVAELSEAKEAAVKDMKNHGERLENKISLCKGLIDQANSPKRIRSVVQDLAQCRSTIRELKDNSTSLNKEFLGLIRNAKTLQNKTSS